MKFFIPKLSVILIATAAYNPAYAGFDFNQQPVEQVIVQNQDPVDESTDDRVMIPVGVSSPFEIIDKKSKVAELPPVSILKEKKSEPKAVLHVFSKDAKSNIGGYNPALASTVITNDNYKNISVETWKANEGESLRKVIDRWSKRAETSMVWELAERKIVLESVSYFGSFEDALIHLFDEGMQGTVEGQLSYMEDIKEQDVYNVPAPVSSKISYVSIEKLNQLSKPKSTSEEKKWKIRKEDSLKRVLSEWQKPGEYELIWDYPYDIKVENGLFVYGTIEEALNLLLDGYQSMGTRPVGNMYKDPNSGMVYLHVKREE